MPSFRPIAENHVYGQNWEIGPKNFEQQIFDYPNMPKRFSTNNAEKFVENRFLSM